MTEIKCKISDLQEICQIVSLKGKDIKGKEFLPIPDFLIQSKPNESLIEAVDAGGHLAVRLQYKINTISEGLIVIGEVEKFQKYLERFNASDEVTLTTTENRIIITRAEPKKVARIPLASLESLTTHQNAKTVLDKFSFSETDYPKSQKSHLNLKLVAKAEDIKAVIDDGEVVGQRIYPWKVENGNLSVKVGTEQLGEIETIIKPSKIESDSTKVGSQKTSAGFAYGIDNIFGNLIGEVEIFLIDDVENSPLALRVKQPRLTLTAILAPVSKE